MGKGTCAVGGGAGRNGDLCWRHLVHAPLIAQGVHLMPCDTGFPQCGGQVGILKVDNLLLKGSFDTQFFTLRDLFRVVMNKGTALLCSSEWYDLEKLQRRIQPLVF